MNDRQSARIQIAPWVRPLILDLGCCGTSALHIGAPRYSLPGFDGSAYDLAPEHANVLIVAGRVSPALAASLRTIYDRLAAPQWVIAYGVCAISGAPFATTAVDQIIPVDVLVPGCPPHTDALHDSLVHLTRRRAR